LIPVLLDPTRIHLGADMSDLPDWEMASKAVRALPGVCVVEMLGAPEMSAGGLYIPERAKYTYYDDDEPFAGFEPSIAVVLSAGFGVDLEPGDMVLVRDGDGLEFPLLKCKGYASKRAVRFFGRVVPDPQEHRQGPGYIEDLPWEESIVGVYKDMQIAQMTGFNILLERDADDIDRRTESGLILPDSAGENIASEAVVKMIGGKVTQCKPGDRVVYHPMACIDFFDSDNPRLRVVREMAVLTVV
jgi:co-chaperonin GroES (HSP10)